jgi:hypothetical protein
MWYRYADKGFDILEEVAKKVSEMDPYDVDKHFELIKNINLPEMDEPLLKSEDELENRLNQVRKMALPISSYLRIYPQIYAYPKESDGVWHLLIYDPTDLKRIDDEKYHRDVATGITTDSPVSSVIQLAHEHFPTALIDHFDTEEEKLRDD